MKTYPDTTLQGYSKALKENPQLFAQAFKQYDDLQKASGMELKPREQEDHEDSSK